MKPVVNFFDIIKNQKTFIQEFDDHEVYWELNGNYQPRELKKKLIELINEIIFSYPDFSSAVKDQIRSEIDSGKKNFIQRHLNGKEYVLQLDCKYIDFNSRHISGGLLININDIMDEKLIEAYGLFSSIKHDSLIELEQFVQSQSADNTNTYKLKTKLSVGDISLLFRLLHEEKLFEVDKNTDLYRFIAQSFGTKKSENLSENSIKNKFLSPDNTAIKNLDILLVNLRQQLKKIQ